MGFDGGEGGRGELGEKRRVEGGVKNRQPHLVTSTFSDTFTTPRNFFFHQTISNILFPSSTPLL